MRVPAQPFQAAGQQKTGIDCDSDGLKKLKVKDSCGGSVLAAAAYFCGPKFIISFINITPFLC